MDAERPRLRLVAVGHLARRSRKIDAFPLDAELAAVHAREVEQVPNKPFQPVCLATDGRRRLVHRERIFLEAFRVAANRSQRRLQLVAHGEQERSLSLARALQLLRHFVERKGELRELRRAFSRERFRGTASRQAPCGLRDPSQAGPRALKASPEAAGAGREQAWTNG